jgi:hypothetical protein
MNAVKIILTSVPTPVIPIETAKLLKIVGVEKIYSYASNVKVVGNRINVFSTTSCVVANELAMTFTNGMKQAKAMRSKIV